MSSADAVARLRSLHRTVTERAGALQERFLGLGRPYGESRVLWEIGLEGAEVRELRRRLALDSGYLSRLFLVSRLRGRPVGCGALRHRGGGHTDVKRMWVDPAVRGLGLGRRLLRELERLAAAAGASVVQLETNGALLEAIELYRSAGYEE